MQHGGTRKKVTMTRQQKQLLVAAAVIAIVVGLVFAGVSVSVLLGIGAVAAMVFMHAGGHGGHGGHGGAPSGHQHPSTEDRSHSQDGTTGH
ncbi:MULTISPECIES: hypothetical protein [Mycolicibacterium]|nr:hypothetical protein [Mycolicibacterium chlorophenolicum]